MIGLDTPELDDARSGVQCFAKEAAAQAHTILDGQSIYIEADPSQSVTDRYGRTLAYVWTSTGKLVNLDMISER